ncbi:DUF4145 domain-containing protein [Bacillus subtilis]|uniref:DUF4145 domain-containing protein n=1 Tax=Bacillus subtilis TaxID=1423 RepID=UPI001BDBB048|nr:DUF4145 domain-containing protein [Bacillus subtilis]
MTENIILTCPHCGTKAPMNLLNRYEKKTFVPLTSYEAQFNDIFEVFECPVCFEFQLYHTHWNTEEVYYEGDDIYKDGQVLFPYSEQVNLNLLPKNIKSAYESALKVRKIDAMVCLMALRRTLEMVCKNKGAIGRTLHAKLNDLEEKKILPPLMGGLSKMIKEAGNAAAHGDDIEFNSTMVEPLFKFTNKILEYIYILPTEMARARRQMEMLTGKKFTEKRAPNRTPRMRKMNPRIKKEE